MSRTRLIVFAIFIIILGLLTAPAAWAGGLKTGTPVALSAAANGDAVLLVDLNADTKNDLVVAECATHKVKVFQGDGLGGFTLKTSLLFTGVCPTALAQGNLTGGASPDVVVGDNSGKVSVLQNGGAFSFIPVSITLAGANITGVAVADYDGDGKQDIVASSNEATPKVYLLRGNGTTPWAAASTTSYTVGTAPKAIVAADFNGDGEPDLAVANSGDNTVSILTNNTAGWPTTPVTFSSATSTVAATPNALAAGIVGTSGKADLVVAANGASKVSVLLNDGSGGFPATSTDYSVRTAPTGIGLGDFNADTVNDIVVSASDGAEILFNDGSGVLTLSADVFAAGTSPAGISVKTINGDSLADVAVVNGGSDNVSILLGTPFYAITPTPVSAVEGIAFANTTSLMTFKYDGGSPTFTASIDNWGDTGTDSCPGANCSIAGPNGSGVYTLEGGHTYTEQGTDNIFLTVTDTGASQSIKITATSTATTTPAALAATVADAPLSPAVTPDLASAAPPHTYTNVTVANFTDQNTGAPNTDFSSSIDWGDGSPLDICPRPCATITGAGGTYAVAGTHTYNSAGNYPIITLISDDEGGGTQTTGVTIHANITTMTGTPVAFNAIEGKVMAGGVTLATFTSSRAGAVAADFSAIVQDWGDGASETETVTGSFPNFSVVTVGGTTHKYPDEGAFSPVIINVTDNVESSSITINSSATVADGVIAVTGNAGVTATEGGVSVGNPATFTDENTLTTTAAYTVTIDWGDCGGGGAPGACPFVAATNVSGSNGSFTVGDTHTYVEEGSFTVNVKVVDNDSAQTKTGAGTVTVSDAALSNLVVNAVSGGGTGPSGELVANVDTWNSGLTLSLATFQDANTGAPTTDFDVVIDWGDGSTTNCPNPCALVQTNGGGGLFKIVASHMFTKAGTQLTPVKVTVADKGGSSLPQATGTAAVVTSISSGTPQALALTEGAPFSGAVANFTSTRAGAVASDFQVAATTVSWGDGATDTGATTVTITGGAGTFQVDGAHTYAEETPNLSHCGGNPNCAITVTVKDNVDGSTATIGGGTATVADAPLTPSAVAPLPLVDEGTPLNNVTVLTFTDGNPLAPACPGAGCDFTATIHWGDGTNSAGTVTGAIGGPYTVTGSHAYTEGGLDPLGTCVAGATATCTVTVDVTDEGGSTISGFAGTTASVNDAPLSNLVVHPVTAATDTNSVSANPPEVAAPIIVANVDTWNGTVATFQDANTLAPTTDFTIDIAWGDGTTTNCPAPCPFVTGGGGNYSVVISHVFTKAGTQLTPVSVTVTDKGGAAPIGAPGTAAVVTSLYQAVPTSIAPVEGTSFTGGVGGFTTTVGSVAFTVNVNWGDGTTNAQPFLGGPPNWTVNGTHTYAEETSHNAACGNAPCPLTVTVTDPADGSTLTITGGAATIADAPLTPAAVGPLGLVFENNAPQVNNAVVMNFSDANTAAPVNDFTATISWGDGSSSAGTVASLGGGNFSVRGTHTYTEGGLDVSGPGCVAGNPATCQITVTVVDEGGSTITNFNSASIQVEDAALSSPTGVALIASSLTVSGNLGSFHDANLGAPASDFAVTIDWGDTTSSAGTAVSLGGGNFGVTGTHTYGATGTLFNVTITVQDVGGAAPLTINSTVLTPAFSALDFNGTASPPSSVILPGQSVDAVLTLSPTVGFNSPVTFTGCMITDTSNVPVAGTHVTCSFNPNSVPDVNAVRTVHMIVQTFSGTAMLNAPQRPGQSNPVQLAMLLPGFVGLFGVVLVGGPKKNTRSRIALWFLAGLLLLALFAIGCGGGGPQITPGPGGNGTPAGTYRVHAVMSGTVNPPDVFVTIQVQ